MSVLDYVDFSECPEIKPRFDQDESTQIQTHEAVLTFEDESIHIGLVSAYRTTDGVVYEFLYGIQLAGSPFADIEASSISIYVGGDDLPLTHRSGKKIKAVKFILNKETD